MRYFLIAFITLFGHFSDTFATLNDVDKAYLPAQNILKNPGFENGKASWVAIGSPTVALVTSGSNLLYGLQSVTFDATASTEAWTSVTQTIPKGLYGKPGVAYCSIQVPSGTATHTLKVEQSGTLLSSEAIISNTAPVRTYVTFQFPTSGSINWNIYANADEPLIAVDDCYLGPAEGVTLSPMKPQDVFSAYVTGSTDAVTKENVDWINGSCTDATAGESTCVFNSGIFSTAPNCIANQDNGAAHTCSATNVTATEVLVKCVNGSFSGTDRDFHLMCQKTGTDSPRVAYKPDTIANSWSGYHNTTCSWARTNASFGNPTADATCTLVEKTNKNFGTVVTHSSGGNALPGITFTPKRAGSYHACANVRFNMDATGIAGRLQLTDGTNVIATTSSTDTAAYSNQGHLCGIVTASSTSAITLRVESASASDTCTIEGITTGALIYPVEWSIVQIDQSFPAPAIANSVVSPSSGVTKIVGAYISYSAGVPSASLSTGSWISSITDNTTGDSTLNITANTFSATPVCTLSIFENNNSSRTAKIKAISSSAIQVEVLDEVDTPADLNYNIICVGVP